MGLGNLFGGGSKGPKVNVSGLNKAAQGGAQQQRNILGGARKELAPLPGQFAKKSGETVEQAAARRRALAGQFKSDLGQGLQAQGTKQFDQAKQQILGALPELQRAARESAAATGGLQRGAAQQAIAAPVTQAGEQLGQAAGDIAVQSQQAQNQALGQIFQGDQGFELQRLGIDQDVARTLLETGRSDILQEAMGLAGVEQQLTSDLLGIEQMRQEAEAARSAAAHNRRSALTGSLLGLGGSIAGGFIGRK